MPLYALYIRVFLKDIPISPATILSLFSVTAPSVPLNVQPFCAVIVWEKPSSPNGKITGYDVMFIFLQGPSVTIRVEGDISHYVMAIPIPPGAMQIKVHIVNIVIIFTCYVLLQSRYYYLLSFLVFFVQVRAINEAGPGPYSDPIQMSEWYQNLLVNNYVKEHILCDHITLL